MSFATIVGVGWMIILGDWLQKGGPLGAMIALLAAGGVMMLVGLCYAEVSTSIPSSGGEMAYAYEAFGLRTSFIAGWLLALIWISAASFEALSAGWITGILFPALRHSTLYMVHGVSVFTGALIFSLVGTAFLTTMNYHGTAGSARFQELLTWSKIGISALLIVAGIAWGKTENLKPLIAAVAPGSAKWTGVLAVFVAAPFWLAGFNSPAQVIEEKRPETSYLRVARAILLSIAVASIFYALVILACSMAAPWQGLISLEFPAARAISAALHSEVGAKLVLLSGLVGLLATWNATLVAGSRVLFALGRAHMIHQYFGRVHPLHGTPSNAVVFSGAVSTIGILLGRGMISPIVNLDSSCLVFLYVLVSVAMIRLRIVQPDRKRPYRIRAGYAIAVMSAVATGFMLAESLYLPYASKPGVIPAEWITLIVWAALGYAAWTRSSSTRKELNEPERRQIILGLEPVPND